MQNKTWLWAILIVVVIGGIWLLIRKSSETKDSPPATNEQAAEPTEPKETLAGTGTYTINTAQSIIRAQGRKPLITDYVDQATVNIKDGSVTLADGAFKSGKFTIDMASIAVESTSLKSGEAMLAKHLKSPDFFDAEKYPVSAFTITSVTKDTADPSGMKYAVAGNLTIKDITNPISFPAEIYRAGSQIKAIAHVELDRTKWNVRYGSDKFFQGLGDKLIDDIFTIDFLLVADPAK